MASFLHDGASVGICRWHEGFSLPKFLEEFLGPFSNVNYRIMPTSVVWGPEDHGHPTKIFGLVPYAEISPVSLNLLMMLCTVDDEISKVFAIWCWGTLVLKYSTIFLRTFSQIGECPPIFTERKLGLNYFVPSKDVFLICRGCVIYCSILYNCSQCCLSSVIKDKSFFIEKQVFCFFLLLLVFTYSNIYLFFVLLLLLCQV